MLKLEEARIVLESREGVEFESEGVLNPACVEKDGIIHMFYRAVGKGNFSTIGYCQIKDGKIIYRSDNPVMVPEFDYERQGIEDPRITFLEGKYYMLYTAYDGKNALVAYAISNDLKTFRKQGLITPQITYDEAEDIFRNSGIVKKYIFFEKIFKETKGQRVYLWEKDAMLLPKKINGHYALIHRILPGIQICYFDSFEELTRDFWRKYLTELGNNVIFDPKYQFEEGYIGAGCVPIETENGWLLIYHTAEETEEGRVYRTAAALLDKNNLKRVIGRLPYPLFSPEKEWEKQGTIDNVVFPTGTIVKDDRLDIYYGAADTRIGVRSISISGLIKELLENGH
jgi:beta-1,2-mannobiose phosphorylase / 1,2-beta-oligomannan phosphorylase